MKKVCLFFLPLLMLSACSNSGGNPFEPDSERYIDCYSDSGKFALNGIEIESERIYEQHYSSGYNYEATVNLKVVNTALEQKKISFKDAKIIRESNKAEYSVGGLVSFDRDYTLDSEVVNNYYFDSLLPVSISLERYYMSITINSKRFKFYLYDTPDEKREKVNVTFYVDGNRVETKQIPVGRRLIDYEWYSEDSVYGCEKWYLDSTELFQEISEYQVVEKEMIVYGKKQSILNYKIEADSSVSVTGFNYIPKNGRLVIPKSFENKTVKTILGSSFSYSIPRGFKMVYIPETIESIEDYNFTSCLDLKYCFFEGSSERWAVVNQATFPSDVTFLYNTDVGDFKLIAN